MGKKLYVSLILTFCEILPIGFSENISDLHVRKKRVIDISENGNRPVTIDQVPYIVSVFENGYYICSGSILSATAVITAAHCIEKPSHYVIVSGTIYVNRGTRHIVKKKIIHPEYHPDEFPNDLALAIIFPPIDFIHSKSRKITVYTGPVEDRSLFTLSGWGRAYAPPNKFGFPQQLRSASVPIMNNEQCRNVCKKHVEITAKNLCTYDELKEKCSGEGDSGGALVFEGQLAGILTWGSGTGSLPGELDVFVKLSHPAYKYWILANIPLSPPKAYNPHHVYFPKHFPIIPKVINDIHLINKKAKYFN